MLARRHWEFSSALISDITSNLTLNLGGRYTYEKKSVDVATFTNAIFFRHIGRDSGCSSRFSRSILPLGV